MDANVTLGAKVYVVAKPKLGELRVILDALDAMAGKSGGALIDAAAAVIVAGIKRGHPEATTADILDIEAGLDDLNAAVATIIDVAGLKRGEAEPQPAA